MIRGAYPRGADERGGVGEVGATKLLYMTRMGPNFRAIADIIDKRWAQVLGVQEQILAVFDLDIASGNQLDVIGGWLGRSREGLSDVRYRKAIRVQRQILASSSGTAQTLIDAFELWIGSPPGIFTTIPPAEVYISGTVSDEDRDLLLQFLQLAKPGGVVLTLNVSTVDPLLVDSTTTPLADPGVIDSTTTPIGATAKPIAALLGV